MLATTQYPSPIVAPPLVIAHGLFGSARNWSVLAKRLSAERPVITVDMRNHAQSDWFDTHSYEDMAEDLASVVPQNADLCGHSMGGKAAMVFALKYPDLLRKLVVADIAPVGYSHSQIEPIERMQAANLNIVERRSDILAQLEGLEPGVAPFLAQSLDLKAKKWRLNLKVLAKEMPKIIGFPDVSGSFNGPTLFLSGADSNYVRAEDRPLIKSLFPSARFAKIPGAGHWLHADKPREFEAAVSTFLNA